MAALDLSYIKQLRDAVGEWQEAEDDRSRSKSTGSDHSDLVESYEWQNVSEEHDAIKSKLDRAEKAIGEGRLNAALDMVRKVRKQIGEFAPPLPPDPY